MAIDAAGGFVVVWQGGYSGYGILGRRFSGTGNEIGGEFQISAQTGSSTGPDVAAAPDGRFVAVWVDYGQPTRIRGRLFDSNGAPAGGEFQVSLSSGDLYLPAIAIDPAGAFVVVWIDYSGAKQIAGRRFDSTGAPLGGEFQVDSFSPYPYYSGTPSVAMDASGNFMVAWSAGDYYGAEEIFARAFESSGAPRTAVFRVSSGNTRYVQHAGVASDLAGTFEVVWSSGDFYYNQPGGIFARRFDSMGASLGGEFFASAPPQAVRSGTSVAADASGKFAVAWHERSANGYASIAARIFDSTGSAQDGVFTVSSTMTTPQKYPDIAMRPGTGDFVVVWSDVDYYGPRLLGQRFSAPPILLSGPMSLALREDEGRTATFHVTASGAGPFTYQWRKDGVDLTNSGSIAGATTNTLTIVPVGGMDSGEYKCVVSDSSVPSNTVTSGVATLDVILTGTPHPLGTDFQINTSTLDSQYSPALAAHASGDLVVVWNDNDSGMILAQRFDSAGSRLGGEFRVSNSSGTEPAAAADPSGGFVVVWKGPPGAISGRRFDSTGSALGGEIAVVSGAAGYLSPPSTMMSTSGEFLVVWGSAPPGSAPSAVLGRLFDGAGAPRGAAFQINTTPGRRVIAEAAASAAGNFVVAWSSERSYTSADVRGQRIDATGLRVGPEILLSTSAAARSVPSVAADSGGGFLAVWGSDGSQAPARIVARRVDSGGVPVGAEISVASLTPEPGAGRLASPDVDVGDAGTFVVTWTDQDPYYHSDIFARVYDDSTTPVGSPFPINSRRGQSQLRPAIEMLPSGEFVATWESFRQDGSGFGIFARRFTLSLPPSNEPPVADAGSDMHLECTSPAGASVRLDASSSSDPDSSTGTNDDIVRFEWIEDLGLGSERSLGEGEVLDAVLASELHSITLRVTDHAGLTDTDEVIVVVADTAPPALSVNLSPQVLWPPNHRLIEVDVLAFASDLCGGTMVTLAAADSSEADDAPGAGDGETSEDIQDASTGTADFHVLLRAERAARGAGRTYTLRYSATDDAGNASSAQAVAIVPHDQGGQTDPLLISAREELAGTLLDWTPVAGAIQYNVIHGEILKIRRSGQIIDLGPTRCVESGSIDRTTAGFEDSERPSPGEAFFYLVEYDHGAPSAYGSESAAQPRVAYSSTCP